MFGMRGEFLYLECDHCGCLSLQNPPSDMSPFYPPEKYYSFNADVPVVRRGNRIRRWAKRVRDNAACFGRGGISGAIARRFPNQDATECRNWIRHTSLNFRHARILDVGCGSGWHLRRLQQLGFTDLTGIDPYLSNDLHYENVNIYARPILTLKGRQFDLVMLHHSFEHMPDPIGTLTQIRELMASRGECLIRVPVVSRGPWRMYGTCWAEIDAPRHYVLHTELSLKIAAERAGLAIKCIQYESDVFTYLASELYRRDLSLHDSATNSRRDWNAVFPPDELHQFESIRRHHHVPGWAGRAAFFLTPRTSSDLDIPVFAG